MKQNLVYLLKNISKTSGKRFYVGSKQEASVEEFDGVMTILDRNDKPYYSSSTSIEMAEDMKNGHIFVAEVLEYVMDRKDLLGIENDHINRLNAVKSDEYYNKSNALLNCHDQGAVANKFGETVKDLANRNSAWSKRDNEAKVNGFENFGHFHMWIHTQLLSDKTPNNLSLEMNKHRKYVGSLIKGIDLDKAYSELNSLNAKEIQSKLRYYIANGCSLYYACELCNIELPTGRIMLGDFNKDMEKSFRVALKRQMSKEEMELKIVRTILEHPVDGYGFKEAAKDLGLSLESTKRYFIRYLKKNLKLPEDK